VRLGHMISRAAEQSTGAAQSVAFRQRRCKKNGVIQGSVDAFEAFTCAYITTSVVYGFPQVLFGRCNCDSEKRLVGAIESYVHYMIPSATLPAALRSSSTLRRWAVTITRRLDLIGLIELHMHPPPNTE
jgi:hypothetical protein